ncbi:hypothetical protein Tco_0941046 [Tanacetum coccineum]|uniref:Uncharacterized protein n=1 Tax=Tanacetum coccineum TaxID=301880 RepID=A0ABQ5DPR1_9ASTR
MRRLGQSINDDPNRVMSTAGSRCKFALWKDIKEEVWMEGNKESRKFSELYSSTVVIQSTNSNNNSHTNEADSTAYGVSVAHTQSNPISGDNLSDVVICAFLSSQPNSPQPA